MKQIRWIYILLLIGCGMQAWAQRVDSTEQPPIGPTLAPFDIEGDTSRGFYGPDDRKDATDAVGFEQFVRATAVMVNKSKVHEGYIRTGTLRDYLMQAYWVDSFYSNVSYLDQPACGTCTGFLIAPDILVTAGHCIEEFADCEDYVWLFDYTNELDYNADDGALYIDNNNVVECSDILSRSLDPANGDYAIIRLKRPIDRMPYRFRMSGKIADNEDVYMIGSPSGLPLKFAENAWVRFNEEEQSFEANLDAFGGNSGGPVFDVAGWIEGILVRGAEDYSYNSKYTAVMVSEHENEAYYGEDVQRITSLPRNIRLEAIYNNIKYAITQNDMNRLRMWLAYSGITESEYTQKRGRFETLAMEANNVEALKLILESAAEYKGSSSGMALIHYLIKEGHTEYLDELLRGGMNPSKQDDAGKTALHWAIEMGNLDALNLLLKYGARVNLVESDMRESALHFAVRENNLEAVSSLLRSGIQLDLENNDGNTACKLAKKLKYKEIAKLIRSAERGKLDYYNAGW